MLISSIPLLTTLYLASIVSSFPQDTATSVVTASTITVAGSTGTSYAASPSTPASPQYTDALTRRTSILNSTNYFRYQHNASFLLWNESLATYASSYAARCMWSHSHGPQGYGENLARGYPDITSSVDAWGDERAQYTFSPASAVTGFTEATGHFTQLVWRGTQTVGCGVYACDGQGGIGGYMLVCEYWPPGNIEGSGSDLNLYFESNVQAQVHDGSSGFDVYSATVGASGVGTAQATGTSTPSVQSSKSGARWEGLSRWHVFGLFLCFCLV